MTEKRLQTLIINKDFKKLIQPLSAKDFELLENDILRDGCREPLLVCDDYIVDGFNRYAICTKHHIPFYIQDINLGSDAEITAWICINQLTRTDLAEDRRAYLIGKRYFAEQQMCKDPSVITNLIDIFEKNKELKIIRRRHHRSVNALRLAEEYSVCCGTIIDYYRYAKAIDIIYIRDSDLAEDILSGMLKLSRAEVLRMTKKSIDKPRVKKSVTSKTIIKTPKEVMHKITVKDMPTYDPDAEIQGLTYTIPSWIGSIDRVLDKQNFNESSKEAKEKLITELNNLKFSIDTIILSMEDINGRI